MLNFQTMVADLTGKEGGREGGGEGGKEGGREGGRDGGSKARSLKEGWRVCCTFRRWWRILPVRKGGRDGGREGGEGKRVVCSMKSFFVM